ncbi:MAG: Ferrous iron permease EfeU [Candidatus Thorarchaeota archaeon AB_25]|nr:MAG: Ferrous iron permease EfeU [Candidatus Thorarchaeota archaeon AB_25]
MIISPTIISLREGIEAALIIAIMLSYLRKTNQNDLRKYVISGTIVAILASLGVATVVGLLWGIFEGPMLNVFEGSVVLIAAMLLTTMIVWMWNAGAKVTQEIEESMEMSVVQQSGIGLALLSFSLVVREGVELSLFSMALVIQEGLESYIGIALGLSIAVVLGFGIYKGSLRISMKALFKWTSIFLILFAAGMVAYGIHELQEAGLLLIGPIEVWNINPPLLPDGGFPLLHEKGLIGGMAKALFGYNGNPSAFEVVAYVAYLGIAFTYLWVKQKGTNSIITQKPSKVTLTTTPVQ